MSNQKYSNNKQQYQKRTPIKAHIDSLTNYPDSKLKAYASIRIYDRFCATGFRVYEDEKGLFVMCPSRKVGDNYQDTFFALNKKDREKIKDAVIKAYEEKLEQVQNDQQQGENAEQNSEVSDQSMTPSM
ncbi:MAG: SpoVG family protein [Clostridia bacterium]|nr:SpoVG family protein [Clostridia bacterium]